MWDDLEEQLAVILTVIVIVVAVITAVVIPITISSNRQAKILNSKFGTSYTTADIFWAGETIKRTLIGDKLRLDLDKK